MRAKFFLRDLQLTKQMLGQLAKWTWWPCRNHTCLVRVVTRQKDGKEGQEPTVTPSIPKGTPSTGFPPILPQISSVVDDPGSPGVSRSQEPIHPQHHKHKAKKKGLPQTQGKKKEKKTTPQRMN